MKFSGLMLTGWLCTLVGAAVSSERDDVQSVSRILSSTTTEQKENVNNSTLTIKVVSSKPEENESILKETPPPLSGLVDEVLQKCKAGSSCFEDSDCLVSQTCVEEVCVDPCKVAGMCGLNTVCQTDNHRAACTCLSGYVHGDPRSGCMKNDNVKQAQTTEEDRSTKETLTTSMRSEENNQFVDKTETAGNASLTVTDTAQVSAAAGHGVSELMAEQNTTTPPALRKMYEIRTEEVDWDAAVNKCKADNMTLASIRNIEEQNEFNNTVSRQGLIGFTRFIWLGATELGRKKYDVVWVGDDSRLNYTNWRRNQPFSSRGNHCVSTVPDLQWYLCDCSVGRSYACEYYN